MSIIAVMAVLNAAAPLSQAEAFVLVVLASYADEHGGKCWPSQPTIAKKTRSTSRGVRKILRRLERRGILAVVKRPTQHHPAHYQIDLGVLSRAEPCSGLRASRRVARPEPQRSPDRNQKAARPEPRSADPSRSVIDPSLKPAAPAFPNAAKSKAPDPEVLNSIAVDAVNLIRKDCYSDDPRLVMHCFVELCEQRHEPHNGALAKKAIDRALRATPPASIRNGRH